EREQQLPLELFVDPEPRHAGCGHLVLKLPAGSLDLGAGRRRHGDAANGVGALDFAGTQELHRAVGVADQRCDRQRLGVHIGSLEALELPAVHRLRLDADRIGEAALRQPPVHRHLTAFEARVRAAAGAGLVTLVTLARRLADARARAAADALPALRRALGGPQVRQRDRSDLLVSHYFSSAGDTSTRCRTLYSMPWMAGVLFT